MVRQIKTIIILLLFYSIANCQTLSLGFNVSLIQNIKVEGSEFITSPSLSFYLPISQKYIGITWSNVTEEYYRFCFGANINSKFSAEMGMYYFNRGNEQIIPTMFGGDLGINYFIKFKEFTLMPNLKFGFTTEFLFTTIGVNLNYKIL